MSNEMRDYREGRREGYRVGPYCVQPDGQWAADAYQDERATGSGYYRQGMQDGRTARIDDMGDSIYDVDARNAEVGAARQAHQQQTGGGEG